MNILYVAAEAVPFIKTGGLADVAGALPKALNEAGMDCRVVLPLYAQIGREFRHKMQELTAFAVDVGNRREWCQIHTMDYEGVRFYFLENDHYFARPKLYGEFDDAERFIFFSKAATRLPRVLDFPVDILHANDWHAALVPVYVNDYRTGDAFYDKVRTVLSIHNLKYQGQYAPETFYWTNLSGYYMSDYDLKFYDSINFLKGGIVHANLVNTVSKTYAEEIQYPFFGEGLESVIRAYHEKISGIINGLDYSVWKTEDNPYLWESYSVSDRSGKKENKHRFQEACGLPTRDVPLYAMITRLNPMKGVDLVERILEEFLQEDVQFVVLGTGDAQYEDFFAQLAWRYPDKCRAKLYYSNQESHQLYAAADFFVMPSISEPCGLSQMIAMRYGAVPIVREAGGLRDTVQAYNQYTGEGDGLSFANINAHDLLYTLQRAAHYYTNEPDVYGHLQEQGMIKRFSWAQSAEEYKRLYASLEVDHA